MDWRVDEQDGRQTGRQQRGLRSLAVMEGDGGRALRPDGERSGRKSLTRHGRVQSPTGIVEKLLNWGVGEDS